MTHRLNFFASLIFSVLIISCSSNQDKLDQNANLADTSLTSLNTDTLNVIKVDTTLKTYVYNPDSTLLEYMNQTFIQNPDTIHISNKTLGMINCGWKLNYKGGHSYEFSECEEMGYAVKIKIVGIKKNELLKLIDQKCYRPNYSWYNDSTEYRPAEYYERVWTFRIKKGKDCYIIELVTT